jgi:hypothetical protein
LADVGRFFGAISDEATKERAAKRNPRIKRTRIGR